METKPKPVRPIAWPSWVPRAIFESGLIVFSVLLALGVQQWAEQRRTAARTVEMRGFLVEEIRANRALLAGDSYLPHHRRLKLAFARATGAPGSPVDQDRAREALRQLFAGGLHQATLQDAVWTSIAGGDLIENLEPREMFALAKLYRTQGNMTALNRGGYEQAMGLLDILSDPRATQRQMTRMTLHLEDLSAFEAGLIHQYDAVLAILDSGKKEGT